MPDVCLEFGWVDTMVSLWDYLGKYGWIFTETKDLWFTISLWDYLGKYGWIFTETKDLWFTMYSANSDSSLHSQFFFFLACYILDSYLIFNSKSSWSSTSGCHYPWIRVFLYRSDPSRWLYIYVYTLEGSHWGRVGCSQDLVPEYHYPLFTSANRAKLVPSPLLSRQAGWSAQLPIEQNVIAYLFLFRSISLSIYL